MGEITGELVKIESQDWLRLRDLFKRDWPKHSIGYYTVQNFIKWREYDGYDDVVFYSLDDDWSDGTVLIIDGRQVFAYTLAEDLSRLEMLGRHLPQDKAYFSSSMEARFVGAIHGMIKRANYSTVIEGVTKIFRLPNEQAIKMELSTPKGLTIKSLGVEDLDTVQGVYPIQTEKIPYYFRKLWKYNINRGIYDSDNRLLAWCFRGQTGMIAALQTQDFARKRGLAELVVRAMVREIARQGDDCIALIVPENLPSIALFEKLGFRHTGEIAHWCLAEPSIGNEINAM